MKTIITALVTLAIAGYFAFTTEFVMPSRHNNDINPYEVYSSQSVSPTVVPSGPSGAYGKILVERTVGPVGRRSPYFGEVIVRIRNTNIEYTRFRTDAQGNYRVTLQPNTYYFIPTDGTWAWATNPKYTRDVVVKAGAFIKVDLTLIANSAQ